MNTKGCFVALIIGLIAITIHAVRSEAQQVAPSPKFAYVSVLYHEEFMMGIRALGSSIKRTNTQHDMYLLVTPNVPKSVANMMAAEGWLVKEVPAIANPHTDHRLFLQRLNFVFTKLNIYKLVEYDKIVILDADTMLISNCDELFRCADICAVVRNGFFNAGVMVIRPSEQLFNELTEQYKVLPSYNGGEQGFLNQWFSNFSFCPYYDEARLLAVDDKKMNSIDRTAITIKSDQRCGRLSTQYNGDVGLYYTNDASWFVRGAYSEPKIIHFTFGEMKPWHWYSYSLFHLNWIWFEEYRKLEPIAESHYQKYLLLYVNAMIAIIAMIWYKIIYKPTHELSAIICHKLNSIINKLPSTLRDFTFMHLLCTLAAYGGIVVSCLICLKLIPKQFYSHPYTNFVAFVELAHAILFTFLGAMYYLIWRYGVLFCRPSYATTTVTDTPSSPKSPARETLFYISFWLVYLTLALIYFLENEELNQRPKQKIWRMICAGVLAFCFLTTAFFRMPYLWLRQGSSGTANK